MRGLYLSPTAQQYRTFFSQRGAGLDNINVYRARGGSIIGLLGNVFRYSIPFLKNLFLPEVSNLMGNVANDINSGVKIKNSLKSRGMNSIKNIGRKLIGAGKKKQKTRKKLSKKIKKNLKKTNIRKHKPQRFKSSIPPNMLTI